MTMMAETIHRAPGATEADKNLAVSKLDEILKYGKQKVAGGMEALAREYGVRQDVMVKPAALKVTIEQSKWEKDVPLDKATVIHPDDPNAIEIGGLRYSIKARAGDDVLKLTRHARAQLFARASIPQNYGETLLGHGLADLLVESFERLLPKTADDGILVRSVQGTAKGILSASYRRIDATPMFGAFFEEALERGMVPYTGNVTDTRAFLTFLLPDVVVVQSKDGRADYVLFGAQMRNSDYGCGKARLDLVVLRLRCLNGATGMDLFSRVHLGRRFDGDFGEGGVVRLSTRTENLDMATIQSAVRDVVKDLPKIAAAAKESVEAAASREVNLESALANLKKRGLKSEVLEKVKATYENEAIGVESLPPMPGAWRFSNVLSLLANDPKVDGDEAADLRDVAFEVIAPALAKRRSTITWDDVKPN